MNKQVIVEEIDEIVDEYCQHCLVRKALREEKGRTNAHRFCITSCSIGKKIRFLGQEMIKMSK